MKRATTASGRVTKNTEPQSKPVSSAPESSGPSAAIAPPRADHRAIDFVRAGPDHNAVIRANVVGKAMPAATPPTSRAQNRTSIDGAKAATTHIGMDSPVPSSSISFRPWRSPRAPR